MIQFRMRIRGLGRFAIWFCWLQWLFSGSVAAEGYSVGPIPEWVNSIEVPSSEWVRQQNPTNGIAYLLVDRQWNVENGEQKFYSHNVIQAISVSGVEEISQLSINFDPVYESLTLHSVAIIRNGITIDMLDRSRIDLIQREKELEKQLYNGSKTLSILIEDVRPGDTIEYSFSISGANPVFSGHFSATLAMQWSVPVGRLYYRLLLPDGAPLHIRNYQTDIDPIRTKSANQMEYVWYTDSVKALVEDAGSPNWHDPYGKVFLSDMADWSDVVEWALPLYRPTPDSLSLQGLIDTVSEQSATDEARVLQALHFVQEQVRYLGIEIGVNSHKPSTPDEIIERRYGDCKDKSRLLASLLRGMGIAADPALVDTESGPLLVKRQPTAAAFNHVIVRVRLDGVDYWLDPTRIHQKGSLENLFQPDFDYALVVSEDRGGLVNMSEDITRLHSKIVEETFDISNAIDVPATYKILTQYKRFYADSMRTELSETNLKALQNSYLNYTARYFPSAETAQTLSIDDDEEENSITVSESYRIPEIWQTGDDQQYLYVNFEPFLIDDHIHKVESPKRSAPYAVSHPVKYRHTTRILMPKGSTFEGEYHEILDSAFRFSKRVDFKDGVLVIDYLYESLADHVKAVNIEQHSRNIRELQQLSIFQITMMNPAISITQEQINSSDTNWFMVVVTGLAVIVLSALSFQYIYRYDPPYRAPESINPDLDGLRGWLILPAISLLLTPLRILWESSGLLSLFSAYQWSMLAARYETGFLGLLVLEAISNVTLFVAGLFLIPMFFTRRHAFPRLFIVYYLFATTVAGIDLLAIQLMNIPGLEVKSTDVGSWVRFLVYSLIWSLYFLISKRVKATFTRRRGGIDAKSETDPLIQT